MAMGWLMLVMLICRKNPRFPRGAKKIRPGMLRVPFAGPVRPSPEKGTWLLLYTFKGVGVGKPCLLYTSDAADDM
eukprot:4467286-Prorocentrum_lima.AAC.1